MSEFRESSHQAYEAQLDEYVAKYGDLLIEAYIHLENEKQGNTVFINREANQPEFFEALKNPDMVKKVKEKMMAQQKEQVATREQQTKKEAHRLLENLDLIKEAAQRDKNLRYDAMAKLGALLNDLKDMT